MKRDERHAGSKGQPPEATGAEETRSERYGQDLLDCLSVEASMEVTSGRS